MTDKNDITGASLVTKPLFGAAKQAYDDSWERTFGKKKKPEPVWVLGEDATQMHQDDGSECCGCCGDKC